MTKENRLKKNFIWNTIGSFLYSATSLVFLVIVARLNSLEDAGIFTFAFSNACVFQVFGTYAGRSYQVTEKDEKLNDNAYFYNRLISVLLMIILGVSFGLVRGYDGYKFLIVFLLVLYKALDGFSEVLYGIIQKNDRLYQVGISLFLKGTFQAIAFFAVDFLTHNIALASLALSAVSVVVMAFYDFRMVKKCRYKLKKIDWKPSLRIFKVGFFTFLFMLLTQYLINAPKYAIDNNLSADNQTIYGIIAMPATVLILAGNLVIFPFLTRIKKFLKHKEIGKLNGLIGKVSAAIIVCGGLGILASLLLIVPLFQLLYGIDTSAQLVDTLIIIAGATLFAVTVVLSNALIAMRRTGSQAIIFITTSLVALVLSNMMVKSSGIFGGALAYAISMMMLLLLYVVAYVYYARKEKEA
ncbi:lipopolysaccharide biosynthesis protein [Candidatus Saccharibacteria bacterium]|nr:lipopolysaccharide biosynthesis protein [Candidatus Saccharibacteria bacterium]